MAVNPVDVAALRWNIAKTFRAPVGATAMRPGTLAKFSSNLLVPLAADDKQIRVYVILEQADANSTVPGGVLVVPFADCVVELGYTGGTPTVGTSYGISGPTEVDVTETTALLVTVIAVNTGRTTVDCIEYQLAG